MYKTLLISTTLTLSACGNLPVDNRTPEQIKADGHSVKAVCSTANGPGYTGRVVQLSVDSSVIQDGSVGVTQDCQITFANLRTKPK